MTPDRVMTASIHGCVLASVVDALGADTVKLLVAPTGTDVPVRSIVIDDPVTPPPMTAGDVLLAVGTDAASPAAMSALMARAAAAGCAGVVVQVTDAQEPASSAGEVKVALIGVELTTSWGEIYTILQAVLASMQHTESAFDAIGLGDLFAFADATAATLGGSVVINDPFFRVLAYSSLDHPVDEVRLHSISARGGDRVWDEMLGDDGPRVQRQVWNTRPALRVDQFVDRGLHPRLLIPVRVGGEPLGSISLICAEKAADALPDHLLAETASVAAVHLLHHRGIVEGERRRRGEQLRALLEDRHSPEAVASRLGTGMTSQVCVLAMKSLDDQLALQQKRERVLNLATLTCQREAHQASALWLDNCIYAIVPLGDGITRDRFRILANDLVRLSEQALQVRVITAVGPAVSLGHVTDSKRDAERALRVLAMENGGLRSATIEDVAARATLLDLGDVVRDRDRPLLDSLKVLADHDREHPTAYVATVRAYLDAFGDIKAAARTLKVHTNTVRYRLDRAHTLSGLDLDDSAERLLAMLELKINAYSAGM